jgi:hypothetical protein
MLRQGPNAQPGEKVIPFARLEKVPSDDPDRLHEGARYLEQLAAEYNARKADEHYR